MSRELLLFFKARVKNVFIIMSGSSLNLSRILFFSRLPIICCLNRIATSKWEKKTIHCICNAAPERCYYTCPILPKGEIPSASRYRAVSSFKLRCPVAWRRDASVSGIQREPSGSYSNMCLLSQHASHSYSQTQERTPTTCCIPLCVFLVLHAPCLL